MLLYELLTGTTPLERAKLREAGYAEILRRIREEEPPKPSTRLSESKRALATIAAQRKTEPARLAKLVRGELDWIVMKALEKDRTRRYETANGLARDIERYLDDEPVEACPPSATYRLRKFARKHRGAAGHGAGVRGCWCVASLAGTVGTHPGEPASEGGSGCNAEASAADGQAEQESAGAAGRRPSRSRCSSSSRTRCWPRPDPRARRAAWART